MKNDDFNQGNPAEGKIVLNPNEYIEITTVGELKPGDVLIGSSDRTTISKSYDEHMPEAMFEIESNSGLKFRVSGNHLFYVITSNDRDLHSLRLSTGKKIGKTIRKASIADLKEAAHGDSSREITVAEFESSIYPKSKELTSVLIRIAESPGPISEANFYADDLEISDEPMFKSTVQLYDSRLFARQVLSTLDIGNYRKKWPVIPGTVMTAEKMAEYDPRDIYIPDPSALLNRENS